MADSGAVPDLVALLNHAQADGQYAAAAALYNMAAARPALQAAVAAAGGVKPLVALLSAESWCGGCACSCHARHMSQTLIDCMWQLTFRKANGNIAVLHLSSPPSDL